MTDSVFCSFFLPFLFSFLVFPHVINHKTKSKLPGMVLSSTGGIRSQYSLAGIKKLGQVSLYLKKAKSKEQPFLSTRRFQKTTKHFMFSNLLQDENHPCFLNCIVIILYCNNIVSDSNKTKK